MAHGTAQFHWWRDGHDGGYAGTYACCVTATASYSSNIVSQCVCPHTWLVLVCVAGAGERVRARQTCVRACLLSKVTRFTLQVWQGSYGRPLPFDHVNTRTVTACLLLSLRSSPKTLTPFACVVLLCSCDAGCIRPRTCSWPVLDLRMARWASARLVSRLAM